MDFRKPLLGALIFLHLLYPAQQSKAEDNTEPEKVLSYEISRSENEKDPESKDSLEDKLAFLIDSSVDIETDYDILTLPFESKASLYWSLPDYRIRNQNRLTLTEHLSLAASIDYKNDIIYLDETSKMNARLDYMLPFDTDSLFSSGVDYSSDSIADIFNNPRFFLEYKKTF